MGLFWTVLLIVDFIGYFSRTYVHPAEVAFSLTAFCMVFCARSSHDKDDKKFYFNISLFCFLIALVIQLLTMYYRSQGLSA